MNITKICCIEPPKQFDAVFLGIAQQEFIDVDMIELKIKKTIVYDVMVYKTDYKL